MLAIIYFKIIITVEYSREGDELTSISHTLRLSSIIKSKPYISKLLFLWTILSYAALKVYLIISSN
jgi:hypothetical protein